MYGRGKRIYCSYAKKGSVEGNVVYANFGKDEDFQELESKNLLQGGGNLIALIRLGGDIPAWRKVFNAEKFGLDGVIFYPDPEQFEKVSSSANNFYPNQYWLEQDDPLTQSVVYGPYGGDPLSPGWSSELNSHDFRLLKNESKLLPGIPAATISAESAKEIFSSFADDSEQAPMAWRGEFSSHSYLLGKEFKR